MKHIKKYIKFNESNESSDSDILQECDDILMELKDYDFKISISPIKNEGILICLIFHIFKPNDKYTIFDFKWGDIKPHIEHLISYLFEVGFDITFDFARIGLNDSKISKLLKRDELSELYIKFGKI